MPNDIEAFINTIQDDGRREDSRALVNLLREATGAEPVMWGSIIGFGTYHYVYDSGREGDTMAVGFAPRKNAIVLYGVVEYEQNLAESNELGKVKLGKGCVYIGKLSDVNRDVLTSLAAKAYKLRNNA